MGKKSAGNTASSGRASIRASAVRKTRAQGNGAASPVADSMHNGFPDSMVAVQRLPVSGSYVGLVQSPSTRRLEVDLRVDVDESHPNSPPLRKLSWDLYENFSSNGSSWKVHRGSWIVDSPHIDLQGQTVNITGNARPWAGGEHAAFGLRISRTSITIEPAELTITDAVGETRFLCTWRSNRFRTIDMEVDVCQSVNSGPLLPSYDTHGHDNRPDDAPQRVLRIEDVYAEAGLNISIAPHHSEIDDSATEFHSWTAAELHEAMVSHFENISDTPQWKLWGLLAGEYENPRVGGVMFDAALQFGGAGKAPERQGFAVFRKHEWFNELVESPRSQKQWEAARKYLYTFVHEAGHAFNFLHSWDKARPDSLSWMNYDWKYDINNGAGAFWKKFNFRFDDSELLHLRHGDRVSVIMGGDSWGGGGHLESEHSGGSEAELVSGVPPVEVLLRSADWFQFMEPINIELRLRNQTRKTIKLDCSVQPEFGTVTLLIKTPDGVVQQYEPIMCQLANPNPVALAPLAKTQTGADRHSEMINLTFGRDGFYFNRPGQYAIRAIYRGLDGAIIPSNLHRIRVGYPSGHEAEKIAQDYFTDEVGMAIYLNGSRASRLSSAMDLLRDIATRFPHERLAAKAASVVASAVGNAFFEIKNDKLTQIASPEPEKAIAITDSALAMYAGSKDRAANLPHRMLVEDRVRFWKAADETNKAKAETTLLSSTLKKRGVNSAVIKEVQQLV